MAHELRSRLVPAQKRTLFIWALLAALLLAAALYGSGLTSVTNAQTPPTGYTFNSALPYPTGLSASLTKNNKVVLLNWTAPADTTVEGYQIQRKTNWDDDNFAIIVANTGNQKTKYRDTSITVPGVYRYRVSMVQGTEVSSSDEVLTTNVSLVEPVQEPWIGGATDPVTGVTEAGELLRLEEAVSDAVAGCLLYEIDNPRSPGWPSWETEMEGIHCVPLRDLMVENCVPQDDVALFDSRKYTVGSYADGKPAFLASHRGFINSDIGNFVRITGGTSSATDNRAGDPPVGEWDNAPIFEYLHPDSPLPNRIDFNTGQTGTAEVDSQTGLLGDTRYAVSDESAVLIANTVLKLHERVVAISQNGEYGYHYTPPANCHFYGDEADTIASADSEITLATTKFGGKDPGEDIDVFYVDMVQNVEYEAHIQGLDPTSQDAQLALAELVIPSESNHSISEIEPQMKVLDADGNELDLLLHGETESFTPDATARYYFEVQDDAYVREYMSGLYKIVVNIVGESAGDVGEGRANAQPIQADTLIPGRIGFADDSDWYSFTIGGANEAHTIMLDGDVTNHDLLINPALAIMKQNGTPLDADDQNIRDFGDYTVIELDSLGAGRYYAAVSAADHGGTGDYILAHYAEDHPGLVDHSRASVDVDTPVAGNIGGFWDRDRMDLVANGAHNYIVEIAGDHTFDASITLKSDSPNEFPYTFTKRADGKYVLAFVEGGITGLPILSEDRPVHFYLDVEANPQLTYGRDADYVASIKTDQYSLESSAQDQYPANPAGVAHAQVYLEDGQTKPMFAYMNGDDDKDGLKIHYPGIHIFRTEITGGVDVDADAVTGMALHLKNTGNGATWLNVPLRWETDANDVRTYIAGEFRLNLSQSQIDDGAYLRVYNRNPDTTVPYTMFIDRDDSSVNRDDSN